MSILVTGAKGFIAGHLIEQLNELGYHVVGIDKRSDGTLVFQQENKYIMKPINYDNIRNILENNEITTIIHLGAWSTVRDALHKPQALFQQNVQNTAEILQAIEDTDVKLRPCKIIFASSSASQEPRESYYGVSKFTCEEMLRIFERTTDIKTYSLRFGNVWGSRQSPLNGVLVAKIVECAYCTWLFKTVDPFIAAQTQIMRIYGDGNMTRHYIHVSGVVSAITEALQGNTYLPQVFNVSTNDSKSTNEVMQMGLQACKKVFGIEMTTPVHVEADPNDKAQVVLPPDIHLTQKSNIDITVDGICEAMEWRKNANRNVFYLAHNTFGQPLG